MKCYIDKNNVTNRHSNLDFAQFFTAKGTKEYRNSNSTRIKPATYSNQLGFTIVPFNIDNAHFIFGVYVLTLLAILTHDNQPI